MENVCQLRRIYKVYSVFRDGSPTRPTIKQKINFFYAFYQLAKKQR